MADIIPLYHPRPCPICGKPSVRASHPFCSPRCQDIDLNRWLSGAYVIPGNDAAENDEAAGIPDQDKEDAD